MTNVLDLTDQTLFLGERATETTNVLQCIWVYDRAVDIEALREFHAHLGRGRLCRRIERSPLPFGRHRWVSPADSPDLEIVATPRPRSEIDSWCSEQADKRPDAEHGAGWHLAMLPFTDGGAVISLVVTHCLTDGVGLVEALADAAAGRDDAVNWPAAASRRRWRALRQDARQTLRDTKDVGRAVVAAARLARRSRDSPDPAPEPTQRPAPPTGPDAGITLPVTTIFIDADEFDARARSLGGTGNALLAGFAAHLGRRVGRVAADGSVTVGMLVNERTPGDTRANAIANVDIAVDPVPVTTDLRGIRSAIKQGLARHQDEPDERWALLPLVPLIPKRVFKRMLGVATGSSTTVVSTNLGAIDPDVNRPDGTDADHFAMKSLYPGVTKATMHRTNGALVVGAGRMRGRVFISILAYELGRTNSNDELRELISSALRDFSLTATTGWAPQRDAALLPLTP
jgi:diacylglycerol O-acyltransferase / wax synthase